MNAGPNCVEPGGNDCTAADGQVLNRAGFPTAPTDSNASRPVYADTARLPLLGARRLFKGASQVEHLEMLIDSCYQKINVERA